MNPSSLRSIVRSLLPVVPALALALSPSADAEEAPKVPGIKPDAALSALVPQYFRERGTFTAAVNPDVAPVKFIDDDGHIAGFTPDLKLQV